MPSPKIDKAVKATIVQRASAIQTIIKRIENMKAIRMYVFRLLNLSVVGGGGGGGGD